MKTKIKKIENFIGEVKEKFETAIKVENYSIAVEEKAFKDGLEFALHIMKGK